MIVATKETTIKVLQGLIHTRLNQIESLSQIEWTTKFNSRIVKYLNDIDMAKKTISQLQNGY